MDKEKRSIQRSDIVLETEPFAAGAMGEIFKCQYKQTDCVAKTLYRDKALRLPLALSDLRKEISFLSSLSHPFILESFGVCEEDPESPILLIELCAKTLETRVHQGYQTDSSKICIALPDKTKVKYALQLSLALEFLREKNVLHRDLKPANVFLSFHDDVKLADFGLATTVLVSEEEGREMTGETGSYRYMAPEVFSHAKRYSFEVDMYSLSMILYFVFSGLRPFFQFNDGVDCAKASLRGYRPDLTVVHPSKIRPLLQRAWKFTDRMEMKEMVKELLVLSEVVALEESKKSDCFMA